MKIRIAILCLLIVAVTGVGAFAAKSSHTVSQSSPGLEIHATEREDGRIGFTIIRDPAQAHWNGKFDTRDLWLRTGDVECQVTGRKTKAGIEYFFILAPGAIPDIHLTLSETQQDETRLLVGGGDMFEISLTEISISPPQKP